MVYVRNISIFTTKFTISFHVNWLIYFLSFLRQLLSYIWIRNTKLIMISHFFWVVLERNVDNLISYRNSLIFGNIMHEITQGDKISLFSQSVTQIEVSVWSEVSCSLVLLSSSHFCNNFLIFSLVTFRFFGGNFANSPGSNILPNNSLCKRIFCF